MPSDKEGNISWEKKITSLTYDEERATEGVLRRQEKQVG